MHLNWLEHGSQDLRFAARLLRKKPGLTAIAVITLGLGIGAATSVFSIVDAVLLRPLPYKEPSRLVAIWARGLREESLAKIFGPYDDFSEWTHKARSFENISAPTWAFSPSRVLTGRGPARQLLTIPVSASFFETLGVSAALGRTFTAEDERHGCAVVLSHDFWNTALGADASIAGQSLTLDQRSCTVLGVMPAGFHFYPPVAQLWILLGPDFEPKREQSTVGVFARLKPGVTREQAQAEITALHRAIHKDAFWRNFEPAVYDLHGEFTFLASRTLRVTLWVLFASVLLVLLIACLNVASLLLARLSERRRELTVRAALGSGQARLARQVLTESLLLSISGTSAGVLFAYGVIRYFRSASPIELSVGASVSLNLPVLLFSAALAFVTTVLLGLLPAVSASRIDVTERLKTGGRGSVGGLLRHRTAKLLIAAEAGLSFVLLCGAGLLLRSALGMGAESLGYHAGHVFHMGTSLPMPRYREPARRVEFYNRLLDRLDGAALASRVPPYASDGGSEAIEILGRPVEAGLEPHDAGLDTVSPRFFDVLDIPVLRGRDCNSQDRENSSQVAIVNEALAREYFPKGDLIGQQVRLARPPDALMPWLTIVGVVGNVKHPELMNEMSWVETPVLYRPILQDPRPAINVVVRAEGGRHIPEQISALDPSVPINDVEPVTAEISKVLAYPRFRALVLSFFAITALILSAVGLYGVLSQLVSQRTSEFGVRKAVGAQERDLVLLVVRQGVLPVVIGLFCGAVSTIALGRLLTKLLYGIQPADPDVLIGVSLIMLVVAGIAVAFPAHRAGRVDPMVALRDE
jgi:predicted permease